jgi:hypothetical protein
MRREKGQADRLQVTTIGYRGRVLSWDQVRARRLNEGCLAEPAPAKRIADVVSRICGLQAQVLRAAELGLGVRVKDITHRDLQAAL